MDQQKRALLPVQVRVDVDAALALAEKASSMEGWQAVHEHLAAACKAVGLAEAPKRGTLFPRPDGLSAAARALVEILGESSCPPPHRYSIPKGDVLEVWRGARPSALAELGPDGEGGTAPLWWALQRAQAAGGVAKATAVLNAQPLDRAVRALADPVAEWFDIRTEQLIQQAGKKLRILAELKGEAGAWALGRLRSWSKGGAPDGLAEGGLALFAAVRAGATFEPAWDALLDQAALFCTGRPEAVGELVNAIPAERRTAAAVGAVEKSFMSGIELGLALLQRFDSPEVVAAVLKKKSVLWPRPKLHERLGKLAKSRPQLAAALAGQPQPSLSLKLVDRRSPRGEKGLSATERKQLELACNAWDGRRLPLAQRFAKDGSEGSVLGTLALWTVVDAQGHAVYDFIQTDPDSGTVFEHGTTNSVAEMIQSGVQSRSEVLAEALRAALHSSGHEARLTRTKAAAKKAARKGAPPRKNR